jgi:hypothetical protein
MGLNPFIWIKDRVRNAVLTGFAEGLAEVSGGDLDATPMTLEEIQKRLANSSQNAIEDTEEEPEKKSRRGK